MKNLELVTTENFGSVTCDFYRNVGNEIFMTREQIGEALEYSNPAKAIQKLHLKHPDRLESLSIRITDIRYPQSGGAGVPVETVYYSQRGIMEICRWSRQPKANAFMDWVWDIVEAYRAGNLHNSSTGNQEILSAMLNMCTSLMDSVKAMQEQNIENNKVLLEIFKQTQPSEMYKPDRFPAWTSKMMPKFRILQEYYFPEAETLTSTYQKIFAEFNDTYGRDLLIQAKEDFCIGHNCKDCYTMDMVALTPELRTPMELTVNDMLKQCIEDETRKKYLLSEMSVVSSS